MGKLEDAEAYARKFGVSIEAAIKALTGEDMYGAPLAQANAVDQAKAAASQLQNPSSRNPLDMSMNDGRMAPANMAPIPDVSRLNLAERVRKLSPGSNAMAPVQPDPMAVAEQRLREDAMQRQAVMDEMNKPMEGYSDYKPKVRFQSIKKKLSDEEDEDSE